MKWSSQKTILFEVAMIKMCHLEENKIIADSNLEEIYTRIKKLEDKISSGNIEMQRATAQDLKPEKEVKIKSVGKVPIEQVSNLQIEKLAFWPKVIESLKEQRKMMLVSNLMNTVATELNDMTVGIVFQNGLTPFVKSIMEKPENIQELTRLISIEYKKEMRIKLLDCQDAILAQKEKQKSPEQQVVDELDIPVNMIEE